MKINKPKFLKNYLKKFSDKKLLRDWENKGCPVPPPHLVKQMTIAEYYDKYGCKTFIETGTYLGEMVEAQKSRFNKIISIELGVDLYNKAKQKFINDENIHIIQGDSGIVLKQVLQDITEPILFWLDGHYSAGITAKGDKECPIFEEIDAVFGNKQLNHVILIDDARLFIGEGDYPTIENLTAYVKSKNSSYQVEVKNDIIRYSI